MFLSFGEEATSLLIYFLYTQMFASTWAWCAGTRTQRKQLGFKTPVIIMEIILKA